MIVVLVIFFRSICLYFQELVLKVHDKWLNPQHGRLYINPNDLPNSRDKVGTCRFCANSPIGYCRHHNPNQPTTKRGRQNSCTSSVSESLTSSTHNNNHHSSSLKVSSSSGSLSSSSTKITNFCKCISCTSTHYSGGGGRRRKTLSTSSTSYSIWKSICRAFKLGSKKEDDDYNYYHSKQPRRTRRTRRTYL
ncbi:hypothetical protein ACFFRR_003805 [Megaselia abdita]